MTLGNQKGDIKETEVLNKPLKEQPAHESRQQTTKPELEKGTHSHSDKALLRDNHQR